jgi:rubrerythrin
MSFKDTRTAENLMKSFAGESQARMRYEYSAKLQKKKVMSKSPTSSWKLL